MSKARAIRTILTLAAVAASPSAAPRAFGGGPPPTYLAEAAFAKGLDPLRENYLCRFLGYDPGGEPQFDCLPFDPAFTAGRDVALWTPWIFQDGFEGGDTSRWSSSVQ